VSHYVVDASVAVKWFVPEGHSDSALRLRDQTHTLHVPAFFTLEFANALCKKLRREELQKRKPATLLASCTISRYSGTPMTCSFPLPSILPLTLKPLCTTACI